MKNIHCRLILCAKDIMNITGKSERTARRIMASIKKQHPTTTSCGINSLQFAQYTGIPEEKIIHYLNA